MILIFQFMVTLVLQQKFNILFSCGSADTTCRMNEAAQQQLQLQLLKPSEDPAPNVSSLGSAFSRGVSFSDDDLKPSDTFDVSVSSSYFTLQIWLYVVLVWKLISEASFIGASRLHMLLIGFFYSVSILLYLIWNASHQWRCKDHQRLLKGIFFRTSIRDTQGKLFWKVDLCGLLIPILSKEGNIYHWTLVTYFTPEISLFLWIAGGCVGPQ